MLTTTIIAFREFLEAFLLIGIFIGINQKLHLGKQKEILGAAGVGICMSLFLPIIVFLFESTAKNVFTEKNTDILEGYFLLFSGFFIAYVVFSLHASMKKYNKATIANAHEKMEKQIFDVSLFFTIVLFVAREGFEVALLVATTSLFSTFWTNMTGLFLGFLGAWVIGILTSITYVTFPIKKVFQYTQYLIVIMGAAMVMNGISMLTAIYLRVRIEKYLPLPLQFLPSDSTIIGHLLKNVFGLQQNMSVIQVLLMTVYVGIISLLFFNKHASLKVVEKY